MFLLILFYPRPVVEKNSQNICPFIFVCRNEEHHISGKTIEIHLTEGEAARVKLV